MTKQLNFKIRLFKIPVAYMLFFLCKVLILDGFEGGGIFEYDQYNSFSTYGVKCKNTQASFFLSFFFFCFEETDQDVISLTDRVSC